MTRVEWQQVAEEHRQASQALLQAGLWSTAYYVAGYAVECGLKSCILVRLAASPEVIFQDRGNTYSKDCWTHDLEQLVKLAGLEAARTADVAANPPLGVNWGSSHNGVNRAAIINERR